MTDWIYVGKIVNTRGIKGEVKVISVTDFPEKRFAKGAVLYVHDDKSSSYQPLTVVGHQHHKQFDFLTFEQFSTINEAEKYKGCSLYVSKDQLSELESGAYYYHQIIGADVVTDTGAPLGKVKEILSPGANDVWVIRTKGKDLLLPYIKDVVKTVDTEQKRITVHLIPGLIDDEN
ncbi:ribosome maturation factor RimM [Sporolactobacillus putidus]|uniref:Ribosome maturation factor RimM n=1 Tax=Sporolactobacillus putidus TaxID=492735 RepID=A0A917VZL6_9BACL|nr:ribosome maturation factor RimM [Sporolactobacillus putidus]GGL44220.1 ribosome maturation factor RimM [Sporolactobacillus putidus]